MNFKSFLIVAMIAGNVSANSYWENISNVVKEQPIYKNYLATLNSSNALIDIESARHFPKVTGSISRVDGSSSLNETSDAIQGSISMTYPLFDNNEQSSRDLIAISQGNIENYQSAVELESQYIESADAYIDLWKAQEIKSILKTSLNQILKLIIKTRSAYDSGEASYLQLAKLEEEQMDIENQILAIDYEAQSAQEIWQSDNQNLVFPNIDSMNKQLGPNAKFNLLLAEVALSKAKASLASSEDGLSIDLSSSYLSREYKTGTDKEDVIWSLNATYPLFDGGLIDSKIAREKLNEKAKTDALANEKHRQSVKLKQFHLYIENKSKYLTKKDKQCVKRDELMQKSTERYELGRGDVKEVLESNLALNECRIELIKSKVDIYQKYHRISQLNGTIRKFYK